MNPAVRVLIVDDDYYAREAMRSLLARDARTRVWGSAEGIGAALGLLQAARDGKPDVIVLDVRLDGHERAGIDAIPSLRLASPQSRILVTSVSADAALVGAALEAGADGYISKNESASSIGSAVVLTAEGRQVATTEVAEHLLAKVTQASDHAATVLRTDPAWTELTEAVRKVVYLYCMCGLSAKEIAEELQLSVNTVNAHVRTAYAALGAGSRREAFERLVREARQP